MIPIYTDFTAAFRAHVGDTEVSAGQVYTDANGKCDPYLQQAYSELYKGFEGAAVKNITRTVYAVLPAYTSYFKPALFSVRTSGFADPGDNITSTGNFSEPTDHPLWERSNPPGDLGGSSIVSITPFVGGIWQFVTIAPHGLATGDQVMLCRILDGFTDDINDIWTVSNIADPNTYEITGIGARSVTAAYSSNQGQSIKGSNENWSEVLPAYGGQVWDYPQSPGTTLQRYAWINNAFRVYPATVQRQIKTIFYLSGQAPTKDSPNASLGFDDCLGFLAYRAAALALADKGQRAQAAVLNENALGPTGVHQDWGGLYGLLMRSKARSAARVPVVLGARQNARRNSGWVNQY